MDPSNVYQIEDFRPKSEKNLDSIGAPPDPSGEQPNVELDNSDSSGLGSGSDDHDMAADDDAPQSGLSDVQSCDSVDDFKMLSDSCDAAEKKSHFDQVNCVVKLEPLSDFGDIGVDLADSDSLHTAPIEEKIEINPSLYGLLEIPVVKDGNDKECSFEKNSKVILPGSDSNNSEFNAKEMKLYSLNQLSDAVADRSESAADRSLSSDGICDKSATFSADKVDANIDVPKKKRCKDVKKAPDMKPKSKFTYKPRKTLKVKKCDPITGEVVPEQLKEKKKTERKANPWRSFLKENDLLYCRESTFRAQEEKRREIYEDGKLKQYTFEALYYLYKDEQHLKTRQLKQKALIQAQCKICDLKLSRKNWNHTFLFHGKEHLRTCAVCLEKNYTCDNDLIAHYRMTHFGDRRLPCNRCPKVFYVANDLNNHILAHDYTDTVMCLFCSFRFPDERTMKEHCEKDHSNRKVRPKKTFTGTCEVCGAVMTNVSQAGVNSSLRAHHKQLHAPSEKAFKCHLCPKVLISSHSLAIHHTRRHTPDDVRPFVCTIDNCNKGFKTNCNLRGHQKYHKPPRFKCQVCLKEFYWSPVLKSHKCPGAAAKSSHFEPKLGFNL